MCVIARSGCTLKRLSTSNGATHRNEGFKVLFCDYCVVNLICHPHLSTFSGCELQRMWHLILFIIAGIRYTVGNLIASSCIEQAVRRLVIRHNIVVSVIIEQAMNSRNRNREQCGVECFRCYCKQSPSSCLVLCRLNVSIRE